MYSPIIKSVNKSRRRRISLLMTPRVSSILCLLVILAILRHRSLAQLQQGTIVGTIVGTERRSDRQGASHAFRSARQCGDVRDRDKRRVPDHQCCDRQLFPAGRGAAVSKPTVQTLTVADALPIALELKLSAALAEQVNVTAETSQPATTATRTTLAGDAVQARADSHQQPRSAGCDRHDAWLGDGRQRSAARPRRRRRVSLRRRWRADVRADG